MDPEEPPMEHVYPHPIPINKVVSLLSERSREGGCYMKREESNTIVCTAKASEFYDFAQELLLGGILAKEHKEYKYLVMAAPNHPNKEYLITCNGPSKPVTAKLVDKGLPPSQIPDESLFIDVQFYSYNMLKCKSPGGNSDPNKTYFLASGVSGQTTVIPVADRFLPPPGVLFRVVKFM